MHPNEDAGEEREGGDWNRMQGLGLARPNPITASHPAARAGWAPGLALPSPPKAGLGCTVLGVQTGAPSCSEVHTLEQECG